MNNQRTYWCTGNAYSWPNQVNTVRVYNLSPKLNHDECVSIFNAAGIYMILDVNSPLEGDNLDRTDPVGSYNAEYFKQVFGIIESFKDYPNTLAFFSGNEVINEQSSEKVPAYLRVRLFLYVLLGFAY